MRAMTTVLQELWLNYKRLFRLAVYENKAKLEDMTFGWVWNILNPALQILVYWFVFSVGLHMTSVDGVPYVIWLAAGIMPWLSISQAMTSSTTSINSFSSILKNINFPLSLVPAKTVLGIWIEHLYMLLVMIAMLIISGVRLRWRAFELLYYLFAGFSFLFSFGLITSSITAIFKDFQRFLGPIIRLLFYLSNVVWAPSADAGAWSSIFLYNPLSYLIDGYRNCLINDIPFYEPYQRMIFFWTVVLVMFFVGSLLHVKLRNRFIDLI